MQAKYYFRVLIKCIYFVHEPSSETKVNKNKRVDGLNLKKNRIIPVSRHIDTDGFMGINSKFL